ncbi:MAG: TlyA family RNA methyltransferase [Desulfomonile tiedjei]|nr:TlyA family RNA methyltransferase [Desulfomonile tiedjei]
MTKIPKCRLDTLLVEKGLAVSRHKAQALIMAGRIMVDGLKVEKPGQSVPCDADLLVEEELPYVSRGGLKLEGALNSLAIDVSGLVVLDAGASTGGFTDCLLQRGASRVVAVDVGYGQLDWKLRNAPRVTMMERRNIRFFGQDDLPCPIDAAVADLSFISLRLVFPALAALLQPGQWLLALVKPQFEVGRTSVGKGGVVRDPQKIREAVESIKRSAQIHGFKVLGEVESPIRGPKGNREFFLYLMREAPLSQGEK